MSDQQPLKLCLYLARAGHGSRRETTKIVAAGRVTVNGQVETNPLVDVVPGKTHVKVDGKLITRLWTPVYIVMNKPAGTITATEDDRDRPTVYDLLGRYRKVVQSVGRLDWDTEGVLLFTNDGDLAHALIDPKSHVTKTYRAKVKGHPPREAINRLRRGVNIGGYVTASARVRVVQKTDANTWLEITVVEGKYRQIKRMTDAVGHPVIKLTREAFGPIKATGLKPGQYRHLEDWEVNQLRSAVKQ